MVAAEVPVSVFPEPFKAMPRFSPMPPLSTRLSPMLDRPSSSAMQLEVQFDSSLPTFDPDPPNGCPGGYAYHNGGYSWYVDVEPFWNCYFAPVSPYVASGFGNILWSWALFAEDGETILADCLGFGLTCYYAGYEYASGYECTGNESIMLGAYMWSGALNTWVQMFWYQVEEDVPLGGCFS